MRVWINGKKVVIIPGMSLRQALVQARLIEKVEKGARVLDEWGHEMGLDGALEEGMKLEIRVPEDYLLKDPH